MKRTIKQTLFALGATGAAAMPLHSMAQNSVTLYGSIDEGLQYTSNVNGKHNVETESGQDSGDRWGLKGNEDLGAGLKAIFQIENGFNLNNGKLNNGGRIFGRQAYVGVQSATIGTVTAGRQYDPLVDMLGPLTANGNWAGSLLSHVYDNDNTDNTIRVSNSIKFASNKYAGFSFEGMYGFSNEAGGFADNRLYGLAAQYEAGSVTLVGAYLQVNGGADTNPNGAVSSADTDFTASRTQIFGAGINYALSSAAIVGFIYTHSYYNNVTGSAYFGNLANPASSLKFDNFEVNAKYQFTPNFYAGLMYTYTISRFDSPAGNAEPHWGHIGGMLDYNLTKRTDVYMQVAWQHASHGGPVAAPLNQAMLVGADAPSSSVNQTAVLVSFRHLF
ncbi:porin [Paraburkholderia sp. SARCC-3016]|uniref:porin n=1 Tax=Paraburkholderia sp. SARCC-3016 TaxID=3058611 RepID=UPI002809F514|nr:porin [Paraburkholderia sp. SARCC-3016]MDQ7982052.1 porin [Paraburkholderia sp. SARCC-3016]